jgi:hypothetical protein
VEQNFSKALRSIGPQRGSLSPLNEETAVRFAVYKPDPKEQGDVIASARLIWAETYGAPRTRELSRCDRGVPKTGRPHMERPLGFETTTATAWLKKRRAAAREVEQCGDVSSLSVETAQAGSGWTEGHDKEHRFQIKKRLKKELQALADGALLPEEIRPGMAEALRDRTAKDEKEDRKTKAAYQKRKSNEKIPTLDLNAAMSVCISTSVSDPDGSLARELRARHLVVEELSVKTQVLIVEDPASLEKKQAWLAALMGLWVCSKSSIFGAAGPFLKYKSAVSKKRCLHLSQEFRNKHAMLSLVLQQACNSPRSLWKMQAVPTKKCLVLGGHGGKTATEFLKTITHICRSKSRAR